MAATNLAVRAPYVAAGPPLRRQEQAGTERPSGSEA
jgi:hypothetical protein